MDLVDELLTYSEEDRRAAWKFCLEGGGDDFESSDPHWYCNFMEEWSKRGNRRLMILIRRGRYYGVDPTDPEASRAKLDEIRRESDEYFAKGRKR